MPAKKFNTCPITGKPVCDRVYNKSAKYSKEGYDIMRKEYQREYKAVYYNLQKLVGIGIMVEVKTKCNTEF